MADADDGPEALAVAWRSDREGVLDETPADASGGVGFQAALRPGRHALSLTATDPDGQTAEDWIDVLVCGWAGPQSFDDAPEGAGWALAGAAGWEDEALELTGWGEHVAGSAFRTVAPVSTASVYVGFRFQTGGDVGIDGSGADGLSFTLARVDSPSLLGHPGGCLGYGEGDGCTPSHDEAIEGLHVEIDTFPNAWDPAAGDHVAVGLEGALREPAAWAEVGDVEDQRWRDVGVLIEAPWVTVWLDGRAVIDAFVPGLGAWRGLVGFTASTGDDVNPHTIDDVEVDDGCGD